MPLSKKKQAEYMRALRKRQRATPVLTDDVRYNVIPETEIIPRYDPRIHKAGDRVRMNGQVVVIPELDAEGNPIPD